MLGAYDLFGGSLAALGDLNGDGVPDLAVGAYGDDDGGSGAGAVYVLFLDASGDAVGANKVSNSHGGLTSAVVVGFAPSSSMR